MATSFSPIRTKPSTDCKRPCGPSVASACRARCSTRMNAVGWSRCSAATDFWAAPSVQRTAAPRPFYGLTLSCARLAAKGSMSGMGPELRQSRRMAAVSGRIRATVSLRLARSCCARIGPCPTSLRRLASTLPVVPLPKEILVTAPTRQAVKPILISLEHRIAVNQVGRGSVVFTVSRAREGRSTETTPDFLSFAAPKIVDLVPGLAHLPALRSWAGVSSVTPDMQPILGETDLEGLYIAVSSYRGFMTSPAVGRIMAAMVLEGDTNDPVASQLSPRRFAAGEMIIEPLLNQE